MVPSRARMAGTISAANTLAQAALFPASMPPGRRIAGPDPDGVPWMHL